MRLIIVQTFEAVAIEQEQQLLPLMDDLPLSESGMDSLCLAVIVARLEDKLGFDPFDRDDDVIFPVTFGEFVSFYENALPAAS